MGILSFPLGKDETSGRALDDRTDSMKLNQVLTAQQMGTLVNLERPPEERRRLSRLIKPYIERFHIRTIHFFVPSLESSPIELNEWPKLHTPGDMHVVRHLHFYLVDRGAIVMTGAAAYPTS
jgi:hypothetical protein